MEEDRQCKRLLDLIDYVEATERDKLKTVLDFHDHKAFRRAGQELDGLPGVAQDITSDDDPIWLRVDRLQKKVPPVPEEPELVAWLSYRDDPSSEPHLKDGVSGAALVEAGLILESDAPEHVAFEDFADKDLVELLFEDWRNNAWANWAGSEGPRRQ
jgi:hypothetical protein